MAWIEKREKWRLRDRINGKRIDIIKDLGTWKLSAQAALDDYKRAYTMGFRPNLESLHVMADVRSFLAARARSASEISNGMPIAVEEMCDYYLRQYGPTLKGGINEESQSSYANLKIRLGIVKRAWNGRKSDSITTIDMRDLITPMKTAGTKLKYLNMLSHMHRSFEEWNEEGILNPPILLPAINPATRFRKKMRPVDKKPHVDTRVLSEAEWKKFKAHLKPRTLAICEIALRRFLRIADIKKISKLSINNLMIEGLQEKTGEAFSVPVMANQPTKYDFTNFRNEFKQARIAAGMEVPKEHPAYFTPRSLRRTGATWAYRQSKDLVGVSRTLGHTKVSTTEIYLNIDKSDKKNITDLIDGMGA